MNTTATLANPFRAQRIAAAQATAATAGSGTAKLAATAETFAATVARLSTAASATGTATSQAAPATRLDTLSETRSLLNMIQQAQAGTSVGTVTATDTATATDSSVATSNFAFPQLPQPVATDIQTGDLPWLKAPSYLVAASALTDGRQSVSEKPSVKEFMDKTGVDFNTACNTLSGVIGSNLDRRDWGAIMASADPLSSARASAAAQYNATAGATTSSNASATDIGQTIARSGNFAVIADTADQDGGSLFLVDQQGNPLRKLPDNPAAILAAARDFGFDVRALAGIAEQLEAGGHAQPDHVDYAALADGALGSKNDWRKDALVDKKGAYGAENLAANRALATEYGYTNG